MAETKEPTKADLKAHIAELQKELKKRRSVGTMMSNVVWTLLYNKTSYHNQEMYKDLYTTWDSIERVKPLDP